MWKFVSQMRKFVFIYYVSLMRRQTNLTKKHGYNESYESNKIYFNAATRLQHTSTRNMATTYFKSSTQNVATTYFNYESTTSLRQLSPSFCIYINAATTPYFNAATTTRTRTSCDIIPSARKSGLWTNNVGQDCSGLDVAILYKTAPAPVTKA